VASAALQPKPLDWSSPAVQRDTDGELFWKITNGRGAMPAWKQLPETERWQIVNYIRTLKK
jgi:mono/diheme cytochrome c family protein